MSSLTRKLLEILDQSAEYGLSIEQIDKERVKEIARQNVFVDYERLERDEPEIDFGEHAKQPEGLELKTKVYRKSVRKGEVATLYAGQGKMTNGEWTPHGVGIEVRSQKLNKIPICNWTLGTFE